MNNQVEVESIAIIRKSYECQNTLLVLWLMVNGTIPICATTDPEGDHRKNLVLTALTPEGVPFIAGARARKRMLDHVQEAWDSAEI